MVVRFQATTYPGTVLETYKVWENTLSESDMSIDIDKNVISQKIRRGGKQYNLKWSVILENDSVTRVRVKAWEPGREIINRLTIPINETPIEKDIKYLTKDFYGKLKEHLSKTRVSVQGITAYDSVFCIYIPLKTSQLGKAMGMMSNFSLISGFVLENNLKEDGVPMVEITHWDETSEELEFNFCYPIVVNDTLPAHPILQYKWIPGKRAVKAIYNGNYITSDRAWYALGHYMEKNDIEPDGLPIEFFFDNPNIADRNELSWKAEIYFPIKSPGI